MKMKSLFPFYFNRNGWRWSCFVYTIAENLSYTPGNGDNTFCHVLNINCKLYATESDFNSFYYLQRMVYVVALIINTTPTRWVINLIFFYM